MNVREADLIGIGKKFQISTNDGEDVVIVVHDDGRRELYSYNPADQDTQLVMTLSDEEARGVAGILGGLAYKPQALEKVEVALHDLIIEWYKVPDGSPAVGRSIGDLQIRKETGAMIIAAIKGGESIINPGPDYVLTAGSTLVVSGRREHIADLKARLLRNS